jgi:hypothetical protein
MLSGLFRTQYLAVAGLSPREYNEDIMRKKRLTLAEKQMAALDITEIHFDDEGRAVLTFKGDKPVEATKDLPAKSATKEPQAEFATKAGCQKPWPGGNAETLNHLADTED